MTPTELALSKLSDVKKTATGWSARCPAHEDARASLSIGEGDDGRALLHCHAGCPLEAVVAALNLTLDDLMPPRNNFAGGKPVASGMGQIVATYDYRDENENLLFQVVRGEPKSFRQRKPRDGGGWDWSVKGVRIVPFRLPKLLSAPTQMVFIVEGEKDVLNLEKLGIVATCNAGGAGKWIAEHAAFLIGRCVVVLVDNDDAGRKHGQLVAASLHGIAEWVRVVELPGLPPKGDVSDWIAGGGTVEELMRLVEETPVWTPPGASESWPEINSFDAASLPEFPSQVLPDVLRRWVEAQSHATQTPPDMAGLLALAVCSATIARRVVVVARPGWQEPTNLFVAVLLEPGNRKSGVFSEAINPLRELEDELIEIERIAIAHEQSERRQDERRLQMLEKQAGETGDAEARHEAEMLVEKLAGRPEPVSPRLIVDDATSEKLVMILAEQGGRIASMSPEGGVFDLMAGLYSKSGVPNFGVYLKGHSGDDLVIDRVSRESICIKRPALTCGYAIQPAVIKGLAKNPAFRGRGLLARFLYAAPESWVGNREVAAEPVPDAVRHEYRQLVRTMASVEGQHILRLTIDASSVLLEWEREIESMLGDGGDMEIMRDWGAKLAGATLRIAAILHCAAHGWHMPIGAQSIVAAITISRYLIPHTESVLNMMLAAQDSGDDDARYVMRWIERHQRREFSKRDVHQHGKRRFPRAGEIDKALASLEQRGYIRLRPIGSAGRGRPPSPTYEVNPAVFAEASPGIRSHNSQNPDEQLQCGNSGNTESALEQFESEDRVEETI